MIRPFLLAVVGFPLVVHAAGGWDDFSNNLATDLAPFLSLFGEQVTKQYLSESTAYLDYFIFAMAPMGILTAVVSAIRVCGSPALRAFVGRAQEGAGQAEAELCSSTSQDVCEVYHNGGIARVFGRPKILELVYDPDYDEPYVPEISSFREHVQASRNWDRQKDRKWPKKEEKQIFDSVSAAENAYVPDDPVLMSAPNLSLNIGIKKLPPAVFWAVALGGFLLQTGVLVFAVVVTYHLQWTSDGRNRPESYACPLVITGTILVCAGMFFCAFLIGQSTEEQVWRRHEKNRASIHWLQPGGQTIGDQTFNAFYYASDSPKNSLPEYTVSWKRQKSARAELGVWAAIGITMVGFVLQFTGLRGIHSAAAVAQLGAVMVMSLARAALRMQRLTPEANELASEAEFVVGHELDWLALRLGRRQAQRCLTSQLILPFQQCLSGKAPSIRTRWRFCSASCTTGKITEQRISPVNNPTIVEKFLALRSRLTDVTQPPIRDTSVSATTGILETNMVKVRQTAENLDLAIRSVANAIFGDCAKIKSQWQEPKSMCWTFGSKVVITQTGKPGELQRTFDYREVHDSLSIGLSRATLHSGGGWWIVSSPVIQIESVLGLWAWGLKCDIEALEGPRDDIASRRLPRGKQCYSIFYTKQCDAPIIPYLWGVGTMKENDRKRYKLGLPEHADSSTIWWLDDSQNPGVPVSASDEVINGRGDFVRLFGWYALPPSRPPLEVLDNMPIVSPDRPALSLCAQEILGAFLTNVLDVVEDIGPITIEKPLLSFRLTNRLITSLANAYTESGLGSEDDALSCILPAVLSRLETSCLQFAIEGAKQAAHKYRRAKAWSEAQAVVHWAKDMVKKSSPTGLNSGLREQMLTELVTALCELYRNALRDSKSHPFGLGGFQKLDRMKHTPSAAPIVKHYTEAARRFDPSSVTDRCEDLLSALKGNDLTGTLVELTRLHLSNSPTLDRTIGDSLCLAARLGRAEVVLALLEMGADPAYDGFEVSSRTALSYAAESGSIHTVNYLLDWDADQSAVDKTSNKPIHYAARAGHVPVVQRLLGITNTTIDPNSVMSAVILDDTEIVEFLLGTAGADIQARGAHSKTPLHEAVARGNTTMVKFLIDLGADTELKDDSAQTPLAAVLASKNLNLAMLKLLVENGADVNTQGHGHLTPLMQAASHGSEDSVRLLLAHGADTRLEDVHGDTVLRREKTWGNKEVIKIIEEHNARLAASSPQVSLAP